MELLVNWELFELGGNHFLPIDFSTETMIPFVFKRVDMNTLAFCIFFTKSYFIRGIKPRLRQLLHGIYETQILASGRSFLGTSFKKCARFS